MTTAPDIARVEITSERALWDWLAANHSGPSVWLVTWKAAHPEVYLSREQVLDALVAYGWIDGRRMKLDANRTMQLIAPRRQQAWARTYKERAARLIAEGRIQAKGLAAYEAGRASGLWKVSDPIDDLEVPGDLQEALVRAGGRTWFEAAAPSYRRNVLRYLKQAKRAETRAKRVDLIADHAARGVKVPQY